MFRTDSSLSTTASFLSPDYNLLCPQRPAASPLLQSRIMPLRQLRKPDGEARKLDVVRPSKIIEVLQPLTSKLAHPSQVPSFASIDLLVYDVETECPQRWKTLGAFEKLLQVRDVELPIATEDEATQVGKSVKNGEGGEEEVLSAEL